MPHDRRDQARAYPSDALVVSNRRLPTFRSYLSRTPRTQPGRMPVRRVRSPQMCMINFCEFVTRSPASSMMETLLLVPRHPSRSSRTRTCTGTTTRRPAVRRALSRRRTSTSAVRDPFVPPSSHAECRRSTTSRNVVERRHSLMPASRLVCVVTGQRRSITTDSTVIERGQSRLWRGMSSFDLIVECCRTTTLIM